ncbi:MAG TPA: FAD-dependent oxidoreductase [Solirubrobacteraceae bacterium]|nr:FAD-dependent oxidoreductase [Solirubrobacteraceae bacterium]
MPPPLRITIAGGGIAGLTAALRLAERGCRVRVYEQKRVLGGDLGSRRGHGDAELDVYPHMYCNWYRNFWRLHADVTGQPREARFAPFDGYKQLARGDFPHFTGVTDMYSPWHALENTFSGVGPPADMYVFGYASLDLLAERLVRTMRLSDVSVSAFLNSRPYMTKRAAAAYDTFITRVWGIPSYLTAADDFRQYLSFAMADPTPAFWLPRGSAQREVIAPLTRALEERGVEIRRTTQVVGVSCAGGRIREITLRRSRLDAAKTNWVPTGESWDDSDFDELVLAVPPLQLVRLLRSGDRGQRLVEAAPALAEISRLRSVQVPIINLYFTRKLRQIPAEPVGLLNSRLCLAFTDISQTQTDVADFAGRTVLAVSASDVYALPGTGAADDAQAMLTELARYLEFDPGRAWGESPDIDWTRTRYEPNLDAQLFVNETGSDDWRPEPEFPAIDNLVFAGDYTNNHVGMTTIESAVTSGLQAANAIVRSHRLGAPVEIAKPPFTLAHELLWVWYRYALAPYAAAASAWSWGTDASDGLIARLVRGSAALRRQVARAQRRDSWRT